VSSAIVGCGVKSIGLTSSAPTLATPTRICSLGPRIVARAPDRKTFER
jgi:hypothetical protein